MHLVGRQGALLRQKPFHRAVGQFQDLGIDERGAGEPPRLQGIDARHRGLVLRVGAVLRVEQVAKSADPHQPLLQHLDPVQARQQGGGTLAQPPLIRMHFGSRRVERYCLRLPIRDRGKQVVQVPREFNGNVCTRTWVLHGTPPCWFGRLSGNEPRDLAAGERCLPPTRSASARWTRAAGCCSLVRGRDRLRDGERDDHLG
jgi:hypothetical protein